MAGLCRRHDGRPQSPKRLRRRAPAPLAVQGDAGANSRSSSGRIDADRTEPRTKASRRFEKNLTREEEMSRILHVADLHHRLDWFNWVTSRCKDVDLVLAAGDFQGVLGHPDACAGEDNQRLVGVARDAHLYYVRQP